MTFSANLIQTLFEAQWSNHVRNRDHYRFGPCETTSFSVKFKDYFRGKVRKLWRLNRLVAPKIDELALNEWSPLLSELDWLHETFQDEESKTLLVQLLAYRLMGPRAVRLPLSSRWYWKQMKQLEKLADESTFVRISFNDWKLSLHDLSPIGFPLQLYIRPPNIMAQFVQQQYCPPGTDVAIQRGDVVIDGGACFGDSALYFANRCGDAGKVYSFEFVPSNLAIFAKNLTLNPRLANSIDIVERALWSESGKSLFVTDDGPGSTVSVRPPNDQPTGLAAKTTSIDDFVCERALQRVDLIKMDIEGAEFEALRGARATIERFRPNLALCVYHCPPDFVRLARFIDELGLRYKFLLRHFTTHAEETVLFAVPQFPRKPKAATI